MGQLLIDAPPGDHDIRMVFELPAENVAGRVVFAAAVAAAAWLLVAGRRRRGEASA
jgi:hypothetical protein